MADFSCYVTINNISGDFDIHREGYAEAKWGGYDHSYPPEVIKAGESASFQINDHTGPSGSEGSVTYSYTNNRGIKKTYDFYYTCPYTGDNGCKGASKYKTKSSDSDWGGENEIKTSGHPFFVEFFL